MSITTIVIGGLNYVSYASLLEANQYLLVDPTRSDAWAALSDDQKGENLVAATRRLDLLRWAGEKSDGASQPNAWPRTGVTYPDGTAVSTTDVPLEVEQATILLAGSIALDATNSEAGTAGSNVRRVRAGSAEVEFFRPTIPGPALQDETAFQLVRPFLGSSSALFGAATGTSGDNTDTAFCDRTAPGLNEGYP